MPPGWDKTRAAILTRDGHRCVYCGQPAVAVNHRTPRAWGGTDEPGNLESVCQKCHDHLTARAAAARRVRR
jgi:5-methylcytosine-specific restriction protein A